MGECCSIPEEIYTIIIDPNIDYKQDDKISQEIISMKDLRIKQFKRVERAINYMKLIKFKEFKVIVNENYILN